TIVGTPIISSPTVATVDVIVSLAAPPGSIPAMAKSRSGSNSGPGGVMIGTPGKPTPPQATTPVAKKPKITYKQPTGNIILDAPCAPDLLKRHCKDPVTPTDASLS